MQQQSQDAISGGDDRPSATEQHEDAANAATSAQTNSIPIGNVAEIFLDDAQYLLTSPARIDGKSALVLGVVAAGTGGLMLVDEDIQDFVQRNRTEASDKASDVLKDIGSAEAVFAAQAVLLGTGWWFRESQAGEQLMRTALIGLEAQLFTEAFAGITKFAVGRSRPSQNRGSNFYEPFSNFDFDRSFPSSHAARAFAVAAVFADRYDQPVPLLAYSVATVLGLSRALLNDHWASDVFAGAALGLVVGKALSWRHQQDAQPLTLLPYVAGDGRGGLGLTARYSF